MKLKKIVLLISLFMTFAITGCGEEKQKQTEEVKIDYTPIKITEKYPEALQTRDRIMKEIRESIKSQKVYRIKKNLTNNTEEPCPDDEKESHDVWSKKIYIREKMYDLKNREIYQIEDREAYSKGGGSGARKTGGGIYRYCPKEEGTLYDEKGRVKSKIKVLESENKYSGIEDSGRKSVLRNEERFGDWHSQFTEYKYDEKGNISKEEITMLDVSSELYEKEIKEYDENEKLIKKFVLRKNKFNSVRSETNFDLIKGEIITKYYEGDKVFATVTETLIGKDREIVKRERDGDEFVIWDEYELKISSNKYPINFYNRIVVYKNNQIKYYYENYEESTVWKYNDGKNGITKDSYRKEHLLTKNIDLDEGLSLYLSKEFYEIEYNNGSINKIYLKKYKENPKLAKNLWDKDLINDMPDESYKQEIQKYLVIEEIKNNKIIEERINKVENIILGGSGNEY